MIKKLIRYFKENPTEYFAVIIGSSIFFILPFLYQERMLSGIQKLDLYSIWILGFLTWFGQRSVSIQKIDALFGIGVLLAATTSVFLANNDTNSYKIVITLFFYFSIYCYLCDKPNIGKCLILMVIPSLIYQEILGYWQYYYFHKNALMIQGTFFNSGYFANWLAPLLVLLLIQINIKTPDLRIRSIWIRMVLYILFLAGVLLVFVTLARAAILGFIMAILFLGALKYKRFIQNRLGRLILYTVGLLIAVISVGLYIAKVDSALGRLLIYKVSLNMIWNHFLFGLGSNRFQVYYNIYQAKYFQTHISDLQYELLAGNTFEAFNFILQWMAEYGILSIIVGGTYIYFYYRYRIVWLLNIKYINIQHGYVAAIICIFTSALFSNTFHSSVNFLLFIVLLANVRNPVVSKIKPVITSKWFHLFKGFSILFSLFFIFWGIKQWKAENLWEQATLYAKYGNFEKAKPYYQKAYPQLKRDGRFLYNYGAECSQANETDKSIELLEAATAYFSSSNLYIYLGVDYLMQKQYKKAERNFLIAYHINPSALLPKYQLIKLYLQTNRKTEAASMIDFTLHYPLKVKNEFTNSIINELKGLKTEK